MMKVMSEVGGGKIYNLFSFNLPLCHLQPVPWVSSSRAQRDAAETVQNTAGLPSGGRRRVRVAPDTYVRSPTLQKALAPVSPH